MPRTLSNKFQNLDPSNRPNTQDLLLPILTFLRRSGLSQAQLHAECRSAIRQAEASKSQLKVVRIGFGYVSSSIVNRWLRDPSFLNRAGQPDDLPVRGVRSITSLLKACQVTLAPTKVTELLVEFGTIKRVSSGRYRLVRRCLNFMIPEYLPFEPNFRFLLDATLASTRRLGVTDNLPKLFWQCADSKGIHHRHIPEFLRFAQDRSLSFMHEINDWLEQHEVRPADGVKALKHVRRLGVGLLGICSDARQPVRPIRRF